MATLRTGPEGFKTYPDPEDFVVGKRERLSAWCSEHGLVATFWMLVSGLVLYFAWKVVLGVAILAALVVLAFFGSACNGMVNPNAPPPSQDSTPEYING